MGWLQDDHTVQVLVTLLDEEPITVTQGRGRQMAVVLEKLAQAQEFSRVDPLVWQREIRRDREFPGRHE